MIQYTMNTYFFNITELLDWFNLCLDIIFVKIDSFIFEGQIRHFRDLPSENLDPRIVLITGSEAVQSSTAVRTEMWKF